MIKTNEAVETKYLFISFDYKRETFVNEIICLESDSLIPDKMKTEAVYAKAIKASILPVAMIPYIDEKLELSQVVKKPFIITAIYQNRTKSGFTAVCSVVEISMPLDVSIEYNTGFVLTSEVLDLLRSSFVKQSKEPIVNRDVVFTSFTETTS